MMTPATYRAIRKSLGVTQAEWAALAGTTQRNIARYEGGEAAIPLAHSALLRACARDSSLVQCLQDWAREAA